MRKYLFLGLSIFLIHSTALYAAATVKLADYIMSSSGLLEILGKSGIKGTDAKQVESYVFSSLNAFGGKKNLSKAEFSEILSNIPVTQEDANIRKELQVLLDKSDGDIKKEDVATAVNNIIYLANRYGKSVIVTCAECVSDSLVKNGFKFTVDNIKDSTSVGLLSDILPTNPKDLNTFISSKVIRLKLGDYSKVTTKMILPTEERTFALF